MERLRVREVGGAGVLLELVDTRCDGVGQREGGMIDAQRSAQRRIKRLHRRSGAQRGRDQAGRAGAHTAGAARGSAGARARSTGPKASHAAAWSTLNQSSSHTAHGSAGLGAQDVGVGDGQVIARDGQVEVVFQRHRDGVVQRKHQLAVVHGLIEAVGVACPRLLHHAGRVRGEQVQHVGPRLGIVNEFLGNRLARSR